MKSMLFKYACRLSACFNPNRSRPKQACYKRKSNDRFGLKSLGLFLDNLGRQPLLQYVFGIVQCRVVVNVVFPCEQFCQCLGREVGVLYVFPKVCRTFIHRDYLCEVNVAFAFRDNDALATNFLQNESFLYSPIL